jgi:hypothetical protein
LVLTQAASIAYLQQAKSSLKRKQELVAKLALFVRVMMISSHLALVVINFGAVNWLSELSLETKTGMQAAEVQGPGLLLVLFLGDRIASVGKSWCPGKILSFSVLSLACSGLASAIWNSEWMFARDNSTLHGTSGYVYVHA